ncbi:MAG: bifunctional UDP-sugar hydrolase/5'-nucleotidase [Myxococcota bacterium]
MLKPVVRRPVLAALVALALSFTAQVGVAQKSGAQQKVPTPPKQVLILATSDEHGWMSPLTSRNSDTFQGGMAYLMGQLVGKERYSPQNAVLVSGGDMWTGPYESTVLQGRPMVQVMNAMGYDAASLGNHEFDFGPDALARRASEASFPLLAANVYQRGTRQNPRFVRPWTITEAGGVKVGLIGLSTVETPHTTDKRNVGGFEFGPYLEALQREVPALKAAGAQVIVLLAHADLPEMKPLAPHLRAMGIHLVICGHRHVSSLETDDPTPGNPVDDVIFCNPGGYARAYCRVVLTLDGDNFALQGTRVTVEPVAGNIKTPNYAPHDGLMGVIAEARLQADARGAELLAEVPQGLHRQFPVHTMGYLVVDSWMEALPHVDAAVTNMGGFRQDVEGPAIHMKDLIGAMPFDNYLLVVSLTGEQLIEVLSNPQSIPGGLTVEFKQETPSSKRTILNVTDRRGAPLDRKRTYRVVINDFMYRGGDQYRFKEYDANPEETALHWREPVARYLRAQAKGGKPVTPSTTPRLRLVP